MGRQIYADGISGIDLGELLKNPVYTGGATTGGGAQAEGSAASDSPEASDGVTITIR